METFLVQVSDSFDVKGRGLIIAPVFPVKDYHFSANEKVRIETPDGESTFCEALFQVPFQSPPPKEAGFCCALIDVQKEAVPIGSKLFIVGKSRDEITKTNT